MAGRGKSLIAWLGATGARVHEGIARRRGVAIAGAELLGLSAIVVAQPVFDALQRSTYAFGAAGVQGFELALLALALVLVPPAVMLGVELLAGLISRPLRGLAHLSWIALLVALLGWQAVKQAGAGSHLLHLAIPAAGFLGAAALYLRHAAVRSLLRFLALAAPAVLLLFLFTSPIRSFTLPRGSDVPGAEVDSRTPVVVVVLDELPLAGLLDRSGRIDARRFPNFAALARGSDWFRDATTVADTTEQAVPAILTGDFPEPNGLANYSDRPRNLFTLLGRSYPSNISESATSLCPPQLCAQRGSLLDRLSYLNEVGFETADSFPLDLGTRLAKQLESGTPGAIVPGDPDLQVRRFIARLRSPPGGSLDFIHVGLPHIPYQYMPSGRRYQTALWPLGLFGEDWLADQPGFLVQGLQRMLLQTQHVDSLLGEVIARMRRTGLYRRALLAVVADHGAAFIPGDSRRLISRANAGWILRVPLFVKLPGQVRGRVISRPVRTIDLLPTIAGVLGVRMPWPVDGTSLLRRSRDRFANTYMSDRADVVHVPAARVRREFFAARAVRNWFFATGNLFTMGAGRGELRRRLRGARRLPFAYQSLGGASTDSTYRPGSGIYPSLVYGRFLDPPPRLPERLVATLDGRPVAVAFTVDRGAGFATLIPPSAFRPGENDLQVYAPSGGG